MRTFTEKQLAEVIEKHQLWLNDDDDGECADLSYSNLIGSDLSGSDLSYSNLRGSDLRYSNLSGSNLRGSDLSGSNLSYSNLRGSDLSGSNLSYSNLRGSDLRYSDLSGSNLRGSNLSGSNLRGSDLSGSNLSGSDLRGSDLRGSAGNRSEIKSLFISDVWPITYTAEYLQIGCQRHKISEWWDFSDDKIERMESRALNWWNENKDFIRSAIEKYPAKPTGKEGNE